MTTGEAEEPTASTLRPAQEGDAGPGDAGPAARALRHVAARASGPPVDAAWRVTLNFHPDRSNAGAAILDSMAGSGIYSSQFVTGTGNGGLTARPGGDRWHWESRMFAGAYDEAPAAERPVYGGLNFRRRSFGAAPRFGSAHLRLRAEVLGRSTFCYPDSCFSPDAVGVAARLGLVERAVADGRDVLDDYVEAQVHGPVLLSHDVEALVLDPSHRGTPVEAAARRLPCPLEWHAGFRVSVATLRQHPDYRGEQYVDLAERIAVGGWLDPDIVGRAVAAGRHDPAAVKRVWHYVARFGAAHDSSAVPTARER
ncbi:DUF3626 domain-containing protein [Streptomyces lonarensis]|uniref:DUF3626 domain-containing protein n=1 Tax=Streptomyces lonarensis TaxID=700599 RepID=A0A7X6D2P2_9ACTN|nr:DUF3626 domain-containing protein [Streptomyces lonarensis]